LGRKKNELPIDIYHYLPNGCYWRKTIMSNSNVVALEQNSASQLLPLLFVCFWIITLPFYLSTPCQSPPHPSDGMIKVNTTIFSQTKCITPSFTQSSNLSLYFLSLFSSSPLCLAWNTLNANFSYHMVHTGEECTKYHWKMSLTPTLTCVVARILHDNVWLDDRINWFYTNIGHLSKLSLGKWM